MVVTNVKFTSFLSLIKKKQNGKIDSNSFY